MLNNLKILYHQGKQYIPDVTKAKVPGIFRGRPVITNTEINEAELVELCPTNAITANPFAIDLGKCTFAENALLPNLKRLNSPLILKISTNERSRLIIKEGDENPIELNPDVIRKEIHALFSGSLKLRQVSAAGDNSCELELNACSNVNFDMGRFGIEFVASPRHADGIVITGPISENMAIPLQTCYDATPDPKIIILAGTDAISGGIFEGSKALNRSFLDKYKIDLYVPGNPVHPLTFINGILHLLAKRKIIHKTRLDCAAK